MKKTLMQACLLFIFSSSFGQGITLIYNNHGGWNNANSWIQINTPVGQTPIQRIPTELDDVVFSGTQSGLTNVILFFNDIDSLTIGGLGTIGNRCRSMRISNSTVDFSQQAPYTFRLNVFTGNGGRVLIDSNSTVPRGQFFLYGGSATVTDLEILNSSFGTLFSHEDWSDVYVSQNGKARFINSSLHGYYFGSMATGGNIFINNCTFMTNAVIFGESSVGTLTNSTITNEPNNGTMNFHIGKNAVFTSNNVNIISTLSLDFYTSGSTLKGNVTLLHENGGGGFEFRQADPSNPLPNIIDGNVTFSQGQGTVGIRGDLKISGNLTNIPPEELFYPDTAHVFVNGQDVFKIGGITNFGNNVYINNCVNDLCHFKLEFFGTTNSTIRWTIGFPIDTMIINKSGCGKVMVDNSLYVASQLRIQSGQLVLNPNTGIPYKLVSAGNVIISNGAGIFLRRNAAGVPANMAIGGILVNNNTTSDSTCFGISNPYGGNILSYNPNVNNITVPLCLNGSASIVSNVSGNTYRWERNTGAGFTLITNGPNFAGVTTSTLQLSNIPASWDNYQFRCIVNGTIPSHTFILDVVTSLPASVTITSTSTTFCPNNGITFLAHPVNAGSTPIYQWQVNGVNAGMNFPWFSPSSLANNDQVKVVVQNSLSCASPTVSISNIITVTASIVVPSVTITSTATTSCSGSPVTFTALPVNGGPTPMYQWRVNNIPVASGPIFTTTLTSTSVVKVIMTSSHLCAFPVTATSNEVTVTVSSAGVIPAVSIAASATAICSGANVVFTATPVNGGTQPGYQWQVNGVNAGSNSPTFTSATLLHGSVVKVIMTSSSSCAVPSIATSNSITVTVSNALIPSISITASAQIICNNASVTFTATAVNGGSGPIYQWKKNGMNAGTNNAVFTTSDLANADVITVSMISNAACASPAAVTSNAINMSVSNSVTPTITISGTSLVDQGSSTTLTSSITNGGSSPTYQWQDSTASHSWQNIANAVSAVLNYSPESTGDKIRTLLMSSAICANPTIATSNVLGFTIVRPLFSGSVTMYPNPATSFVTIDSLSIIDGWNTLTVMSLNGKTYFSRNITGLNKINIPVHGLLPGMYMIRLYRSVGYPEYKKFIKL